MGERHNTRARFEQWARNPGCEANAISAVAGVSMAEVAKAEGVPATFGQSPFAIARGQTFERSLLENDAERLREALEEKEILARPPGFGPVFVRVLLAHDDGRGRTDRGEATQAYPGAGRQEAARGGQDAGRRLGAARGCEGDTDRKPRIARYPWGRTPLALDSYRY